MTDDNEARQIAKGLTEAQRKAVLATAQRGDAFVPGSARGIPLGLKRRDLVCHYLTPLGLAVREILENE